MQRVPRSQPSASSVTRASVKPMDFHPGNYLLTHASTRGAASPTARRVTASRSFCVGCHERSGVGTRGRVAVRCRPTRSGSFHPAGWAIPGAGPNLHAGEARRNITSCASCHREEDCLTCHSAEPGQAERVAAPEGLARQCAVPRARSRQPADVPALSHHAGRARLRLVGDALIASAVPPHVAPVRVGTASPQLR